MRIKIDSLEALHQLLRRPPIDERLLPGDEWKRKTEEHEIKRVAPFGFQYQTTGLVYPLDDVTSIFKKFGDSYSCAIAIDSLDKTVFHGIHHKLSEAIHSSGYTFLRKNPLTDDSTGHIFNGKGDCVFSLLSANNGFLRVLSMGTAGSHTRDLPDNVDKFIQEVGTLENLANVFIECLLNPFSKRDDIKYLDDKVLYLNP